MPRNHEWPKPQMPEPEQPVRFAPEHKWCHMDGTECTHLGDIDIPAGGAWWCNESMQSTILNPNW